MIYGMDRRKQRFIFAMNEKNIDIAVKAWYNKL